MKKTLAVILSFFMLASIFTGCGSTADTEADADLIGTWVYGDYDTGYIFNSDLSGTDTFFDLGFTYTAEDGTLTITYDAQLYGSVSYTYEISDDTLTMTRISDEEEPDSYTYIREGADSDESSESDESSNSEDTADVSQEDTGEDETSVEE